MKLASYKDGSRDGQLVVVSRDLSLAHYATGIATRLQQVLDDWNFLSPQLEELSQSINHGKARHAFAFDPRLCLAPLPRAYLWAEARRADATPGEAVPRLLAGRSDALLGPHDPIRLAPARADGSPAIELDFSGQVGLVCGDLARGSEPAAALESVRLLVLANSLHALADDAPAIAVGLAPVAVTPDELGPAWQRGRVQLKLELMRNGKRFGLCDLGEDLAWSPGDLLAALACHRALGAGSIVGCGARTPADGSRGDASIGARRHRDATARSPALQPGDSLHLEVKGRDGQSLFGAIGQTVVQGD